MNVLHQEHEMRVIGRRRHELGNEVEIERASLIRLGVDQQAAASDLRTKVRDAEDHIPNESGADPSTLVALVHAEPCEECHRLRVSAGTLLHPSRGVIDMNARHPPGEVASDVPDRRGCDEHLGRAGEVRLEGVVHEPCGLFL